MEQGIDLPAETIPLPFADGPYRMQMGLVAHDPAVHVAPSPPATDPTANPANLTRPERAANLT